MQGKIDHVFVRGIKAVVPTAVKSNLEYADILGERRCKKQIRLTGVEERHVSIPRQTSSDLAMEAARELLLQLKWQAEDIDVLVFATQNPLFVLPSTAFYIQKELGLKKDSVVFDINLGCSAALVGIQTVSALMMQGRGNARGLLLISDAVYDDITGDMSPDDVADKLLFGSAGTAVALERDENCFGNTVYMTRSDGSRYDAIIRKNAELCMNGEAVFEFGVNDVSSDLINFKKIFEIQEDAIDFYSFHQAQDLMLNTIDSVCGIDMEKELRSLQAYGNTNGSSVLLNLCANIDRLAGKDEVRVLFCAFGVGLSWAYLYTSIPVCGILPIGMSDKCAEDV